MVRIMTDSAVDFEPNEFDALGVRCIPLTVIFGEDEYVENKDITKGRFYELLQSEKSFPHTSQPSPAMFEEAFREAMDAGDETVLITISSALSGTVGSASAAKKMMGYEGCYIVDSHTATGGQRILVEHAVKLKNEGKSAAEIASALTSLRTRITLFACIDTLEYLYKGGRISKSIYALGSIAQIKPILHVDREGRAEIPAKALGMKRGMQYLKDRLEEIKPDPAFPFYIMYTHSMEMGRQLLDFLEKNCSFSPNAKGMAQVGAVVGAHIGPGACGMVYVCAE
ncbi:MAG: DegV family protein [Clostridiales bacterium]|nr:DegV family protein [Clostridiales bacterium]